jgi:chromosome segregation ATPase
MASMVSDSVGAAAKQRIDQFMRDPNMLGAFSVAFQNSQAAQMALGRMEVEEAERKLELFRESGLLDAEMEARMAEAAADMAQAQTDLTKAKLGMAEAMVGAATLGSAPEQLQETFQTVTSRLNTLDSQLTELVKAGEQNSDEAIEIKNTIQALRELESNLINELLQEQRIEWDPDTALPILESVERAFDFPMYGQGAQQERTIFRGYRNRYDPGTYGAGPTMESAGAADSGVDEEVANYYGAQR